MFHGDEILVHFYLVVIDKKSQILLNIYENRQLEIGDYRRAALILVTMYSKNSTRATDHYSKQSSIYFLNVAVFVSILSSNVTCLDVESPMLPN